MEKLLVNDYCDDLFDSIRWQLSHGRNGTNDDVKVYVSSKIPKCALANFVSKRSFNSITLEPIVYNRGCWVVDVYAKGSKQDLMHLKLSLDNDELKDSISANVASQEEQEEDYVPMTPERREDFLRMLDLMKEKHKK